MISTALLLAATLSLAADGGSATPSSGSAAADAGTAAPDSLSPGAKKREGGALIGAPRDGGARSEVAVPKTVGNLSKEEITKVLKRHGNEVRSCYEQSLRLKPTLEGKIAVKFIVGATGDVLQTEIASDTLNDENLKACMLNVVRSWKFPEPKGGGNVSITYPWVFKPTEPAQAKP
jgi:TonB family protein